MYVCTYVMYRYIFIFAYKIVEALSTHVVIRDPLSPGTILCP